MVNRPPTPRAYGFLIAITTLGGALIGNFLRQPSLGLVLGLASGSAIALLLFLRDRSRNR